MYRNNELRKFRTLSGAERRAAVRRYLADSAGLVFGNDPHTLSFSQRSALHDMARAVVWRKSISSCLSLGAAFYVYLSRDAGKEVV